MSLLETLNAYPWLFYNAAIIIGLAFGSFLNVVIYRLPLIMENDWRQQCHDFLDMTYNKVDEKSMSLAFPASACPNCGHKIRFWENIPVISYLLLRGKCSNCKTAISIEYPLVESITAVLTLVIAIHFGPSLQALAAACFTWALIALTMIDFHKQLLPDNITLPLLWLGVICGLFGIFIDLEASVTGAIAGYLALWSVYHLFRLVTGKEGMGYGDFKLLAALGAWMGWKMLPLIILLSSAVGAVIGLAMIALSRHDKNIPIPFGPYLAIAGWIALIWGDAITDAWLGF
ncbi:MAG: prepilin peptidase [Gammaproteobacteria bacterium]|nr:MAG: prepilin peptidase [Gammaproteobacteria bacterium]